MTRITVKLDRQGRHWTLELNVNSQIKPGHIVGCTDGVLPLVAGLFSAEAYQGGVFTAPYRDTTGSVPVIAVTMPSGRTLTFQLSSIKEPFANFPKVTSSDPVVGRAAEPVDTGMGKLEP